MHEAEIEVCRLRVRIERLRLEIARRGGMKEQRMREVKNMAQVIRETVAGMKAEAASAVDAFQAEVNNSKASIGKFKALTRELKEATKEVDAALGETGSNFPTQEEPSSSRPESSSNGGKTPPCTIDANGVIVNNDPKDQPVVDINGVWVNRQ